jgi:phospholipid transport system substrate-binding protein
MQASIDRRFFLAASLLAVVAGRARAQAEDPACASIRTFYGALLEAMKGAAAHVPVRTRYEKLEAPVRRTFDLPAMARIAVGPTWPSIPAEAQSALLEQFARMTIATYASRFDGYSGERFEVDPTSQARGDNRIVRSRLVQASGEPVVLNYLSHLASDDWKVIDVYLNGTISELATRRSEFTAILRSGGPASLVASLRQRTDRLLAT